jgi:hypothetical protein
MPAPPAAAPTASTVKPMEIIMAFEKKPDFDRPVVPIGLEPATFWTSHGTL